MFSKATAHFVRQIDPDGSLIHVSRVNDSHKLVPMALVIKRNRIWFWQRPKYQVTDFTLSDLLQGDKELSPGVSEKEFLSFKGSYGDKLSGKLETEAVTASIRLEGRGMSKLQSCFGRLKKEELDVKKLLQDSSDRQVNMQHKLVQQLMKRVEVLAVVKERILTTNCCSVTQTKKEQCTIHGMLRLVGMLGSSVKVSLKESNGIEVDSDVSLEIPPGTVIAYSVLELEIKKDGHFGICLQPGTIGGIEEDSVEDSWPSCNSLDVVDFNCQELQEIDLSPLEELPESTRCALFKELQGILSNQTALSYLQCVLQDLCCGETPSMAEQSESQKKSVLAILDQLSVDSQSKKCRQLNAALLLVSAVEELPDETLSLLSESCPDFLGDFDTLMSSFKEKSEPLSAHCLPVLLQSSQTFQLAEQLLSFSNITVRRDGNSLRMETGRKEHILVLYLSIHGLSLLCKEQ